MPRRSTIKSEAETSASGNHVVPAHYLATICVLKTKIPNANPVRGFRHAMITLPEAREALLRSGYLLEHRLEAILRRREWYVQANDAYLEKETNKSRELDIYALRAEQLGKQMSAGFVWAVLLIECVNNAQPLAFITKAPQLAPLHYEEIKLAGLPAKVFDPKAKKWVSLTSFLDMDEYHHYCKGRIATQFCSFSQKRGGNQWMASHDDLHFDAFRSLVTALEYHKDKFFECWRFDSRTEYVNVEFYYPVLVVQGPIMDVRSVRKRLELKDVNHIQYRRSSIWNGEAKEYQIDVVTEKWFPSYLSKVERESKQTADRMRQRSRRPALQRSLEKIANEAKRLRTPEKIRAAMEYKWAGLQL
jgi:hypothetical protein